jgi:hypothetical protein
MQAQSQHGTEVATNVDFDAPAQKGWVFFTKFLLWNIIGCIAALLVIGVFTVWS